MLLFSFLVLSAQAQKIKYQNFVVSSLEELLSTIGSDRIIRLKTTKLTLGLFNPNFNNRNISLIQTTDGFGIQIKEVKNLKIIGFGKNPTKVLSNLRQNAILSFKNCENISLENIELAYSPLKGKTQSTALHFADCKKINFLKVSIVAGAAEGLKMEGVKEVRANNLLISGCSRNILTLTGTQDVEFNNSQFTDNQAFDLINVFESENIRFNICTFNYNRCGQGESFDNYALFNAPLDREFFGNLISLKNCVIEDNFCQFFSRSTQAIKMENCKLDNNTFEKGNTTK